LNREAKQAQQATRQGNPQGNLPGLPQSSQRAVKLIATLAAKRLLQGLAQIRQKPVAQSAKIVL